MKKYISILFIAATLFVANSASAQNQVFYRNNGTSYTAKMTVPALTENKSILFPTFDLQAPSADDTIAVTVGELFTWVKADTLTAATLITLTPSSRLTAGAQLYLQLGNDGTNRLVSVKQGATLVDSVTVTGTNTKRLILFDGTSFQKF